MDVSPIRYPSSPRLPPEVISLVFACLPANNDWATLRSCSVLSRQCLGQSRKILFDKISFRIRIDPKSKQVLINHVSRRIQGLCDMLQRDPETARSVKTLELLDSYPVYNSDWIIRNRNLPRLFKMLVGLRSLTFGCEVGYLQWPVLSPELRGSLYVFFRMPHLESLDLRNIGTIPPHVLITRVRHLHLDSITITLPYPMLVVSDALLPDTALSTLNLRTISTSTSTSAWVIILMHYRTVQSINWRCWEGNSLSTPFPASLDVSFTDPVTADGVSFTNSMDLGLLPCLKKLSIRMSYGKVGRDLTGLREALESITKRSPLEVLELKILFPLHAAPDYSSEIHNHVFWSQLSFTLLRMEYCALSQVRLDLTVHNWMTVRGDRTHNSINGFRKRMKESLRVMLGISTFCFKLQIHAFPR
ncbi:hypothetical protein M413DRAFT_31115 [Hebeloma cylindrosporum]|uniref:F-box domain-containing protein n=1 Tax=Hebeloma cylindrosporum TaxID=76867 RepID=A0A0C2Y855_HEBCY|nr:hypothetical protein M413DRAFT_31115 [Hebeloma cylindrosporum h7]